MTLTVLKENPERSNVLIISLLYIQKSQRLLIHILKKQSHELGNDNRVRVVSSDGAVQTIILGNNAYRVSADEFHNEIIEVERAIREYF